MQVSRPNARFLAVALRPEADVSLIWMGAHSRPHPADVTEPASLRHPGEEVRVHREVEGRIEAANLVVERSPPERGRLRDVVVRPKPDEADKRHFPLGLRDAAGAVDPRSVAEDEPFL